MVNPEPLRHLSMFWFNCHSSSRFEAKYKRTKTPESAQTVVGETLGVHVPEGKWASVNAGKTTQGSGAF
jgi:hypothetical protein